VQYLNHISAISSQNLLIFMGLTDHTQMAQMGGSLQAGIQPRTGSEIWNRGCPPCREAKPTCDAAFRHGPAELLHVGLSQRKMVT